VIGEAPVPVNPPGDDVAVKVVAVPPVVAAVYATDAVEPVLKSATAPITGVSGTSEISVTAVNPSGVPSMRSSCALRMLTYYSLKILGQKLNY
jgi:hypothetical protein